MSALQPDADRDIIIHAFTLVDALTGAAIGERWSVWCGRESAGSFDTEAEALGTAQAAAEDRACPVWLQRSGELPRLLPFP
jgi:hypothetical protein